MESQILKKNIKERLYIAKFWARGVNLGLAWVIIFVLHICYMIYTLTHMTYSYLEDDKIPRTYFGIILTIFALPVIIEITCFADLMGFLEKKRCQHIFNETGKLFCVLFFVAFYMCLNELPSPESTRLPQNFFAEGDFITF